MNNNQDNTVEASTQFITDQTHRAPEQQEAEEKEEKKIESAETPPVELDIPHKFTHRGGEGETPTTQPVGEVAYDPQKNLQDNDLKDTTPSPDKPPTSKVPFQEKAEGLDSIHRTEP